MNRLIIVFCCILLWGVSAFGQDGLQLRIQNKVDGKPIAGVSVVSKAEESLAVKTDANGLCRIAKINFPVIFLFRHLGFAELEMQFEKAGTYTIAMEPNIQVLGEALVQTGYQVIPKERATGSFSFLTNKELNRRPTANLVDRLEGTVSGLHIDSRLSGRNALLLRGYSTIKSDNTPLIVLDGAPFEGDIAALDPNMLQSITFLKDAAASSIWGARAGNGVLVVTSKSAKLNSGVKVDVNLNTSWEAVPDRYYNKFLLNSTDFIDFEKYLYNNGYFNTQKVNPGYRRFSPVIALLLRQEQGKLNAAEVNRQLSAFAQQDVRKDIDRYYFGTGFRQQHNLQISNGTERSSNLFSLTWNKGNADRNWNKNNRILLQLNAKFKLGERLDLQPTLSWNISKEDNRRLNFADMVYPYAQLVDANGAYLPIIRDYNDLFLESQKESGRLDWSYNPLYEMSKRVNRIDHNEFIAGMNVNVRLGHGLSAQLLYNYQDIREGQKLSYDRDSYFVRNMINTFAYEDQGKLVFPIAEGSIVDKSNTRTQSHLGRAQLSYAASFGASNINLILGTEMKQTTLVGDRATFYGFDQQTLTFQNVDFNIRFTRFPTGAKSSIPSGLNFSDRIDRFVSYYFNGSYLLHQRYLLSLSARKDASNLFGVNTNQRAVPLWSSGLAWTVSEEPFWPKDWSMDYLKLRSTFGYSGNVNKSLTRYSTAAYGTSLLTGLPTAQILTPPNDKLRWEKVGMLNIGLDLRLKKHGLTLAVDYYIKKGRDLIGESALDPTTGFFVGQRFSFTGNNAALDTRGIDLRLDGYQQFGAVEWLPSLLFNWSQNKVIKYSGTMPLALLGSSFAVPIEGRPLSSIFAIPWAGLDPQDGSPQFWYKGAVSKDYTAIRSKMSFDDLEFKGSALPLYTGSFINRIRYKPFELSFSLLYGFGAYLRRPSINYSTLASNWVGHEDYHKRWLKPGDELLTNVPAIPKVPDLDKWNYLYGYSSVLVDKADYIFLKDVRLSVDLHALGQVGLKRFLKNAELFAVVNNVGQLWVANKAKIDPITNESYLGRPRLWSLGVQIGF